MVEQCEGGEASYRPDGDSLVAEIGRLCLYFC